MEFNDNVYVGVFPKENEKMICFYDASTPERDMDYSITSLVDKNMNQCKPINIQLLMLFISLFDKVSVSSEKQKIITDFCTRSKINLTSWLQSYVEMSTEHPLSEE